MTYEKVIREYLKALENSDYSRILDIFADEGIVYSPLYGEVKATDFYSDLFESTKSSDISLINVFESLTNENTAAGHFSYEWVLKDGTLTAFECVDIFKFNDDKDVKELKIIYDTSNTRKQFENMKDR